MLPGGKLYVPGAEKIIPNIKRLVDEARAGRVLLISHGCHHTENDPEFDQFPPHCIKGSRGARTIPEGVAHSSHAIPNDEKFQLPDDLLHRQQIALEKQTLDIFDNPHTASILARLDKDAEFVVFGVVTEYCVRLAAKGLLERGRKVAIVKDAIETLNPDEGRRTIAELTALGARLVTTDEAVAAVRESAAHTTAR